MPTDDVAGPGKAGPAGSGAALAVAIGGGLSRTADWLDGQSLTSTSASGISLILGICAAGWLTAGTTSASAMGAFALCVGYVAALAARRLADPASGRLADPASGRLADLGSGRLAGDDGPAVSARLAGVTRSGWLATMAVRVFECVVYAGLAIGAAAQGWSAMWPLAITVLSLVSIHETMTACRGPADPDPDRASPERASPERASPERASPERASPERASPERASLVRRGIMAALTMPAGGRVLLIAMTAPVWGARLALVGLLDWAIVAVGFGLVRRGTARKQARRQPSVRSQRSVDAEPASLAVLLKPSRPAERAESRAVPTGMQSIPVLRLDLSTPPPAPAPDAGSWPADDEWALTDEGNGQRDPDGAGPGDIRAQRALAVIMRCRDDGAISRWFGGLVRGQLMPLPPALLALAGVAMLARLGLRDLPGLLILAPAIVMLVAAPGSSHRHDGRLDWLVPAVLEGAQFIYIAALGFASAVPVAVTFLLCAAVAVRYADLGSGGSPALPARRRSGRPGPVPGQAGPGQAAPGQAGPGQAAPGHAGPGQVALGHVAPGHVAPGHVAPGQAGPGQAGPERGGWLGWEGRMIVCGLGAAMGIAMFAYIALAAFLLMLVCSKAATDYAVFREGDSR